MFTVDREAIVLELSYRDGWKCMYPGCEIEFDTDPDARHSITIDHVYPQAKAREAGWTYEMIWATANLQLMGKICNAKKSDRVYDENGMLPRRGRERTVKGQRPEWCEMCESGRLLYPGEECPECFSGPQPRAFPATLQKTPKECSHGWTNSGDHCWMCVVGFVERCPASATVFGIEY